MAAGSTFHRGSCLLRKAKSAGELLPWLYLKGISSGDFREALTALLGPDFAGLPASMITRPKASWAQEFDAWRKRDLPSRRFVYLWADGVYFTPLLDGDRQCTLVIIGADEYGEKDILAIMDGFRKNAGSWRVLLLSLNARGLAPPELAIGDGALGFWAALRDVFPDTREKALLGAQERQCHRYAAEIPAWRCQIRPS